MPKKYRLSRAGFDGLVGLRSRRLHGSYFSLAVTLFPPGTGIKVACVVSKKVALRAVDRNRIDRRYKEALRPLLHALRGDVALVFHAKREAARASFADIEHDIRSLVDRVS